MLSVIKRLQANLKRAKSEKVSKGFPRYREILQAIVDGNEDAIAADELNQALEEVGKDFEQLEADTKLLEKRLSATVFDSWPALSSMNSPITWITYRHLPPKSK